MSCGTCTSAVSLHSDIAFEARPRSSRLWAAWAAAVAVFDGARRRRVWIEFEKARQRGMLLEMDERLLEDIGITREQAIEEARKSLFWK